MRKLSLAVGLLMLIMSSAQSNLETADIVFKNGNIYTVNERQPHAEAVAVKAGKIIFVGSNKDVKTYEGKATRVVDLHGNTVVPGLTDSHYHLMGVGEREVTLNLEGTTSLEEFLATVKSRVDRAKRDEWITGRGGNSTKLLQIILSISRALTVTRRSQTALRLRSPASIRKRRIRSAASS